LTACRRLREQNNQVPIIMLTAKGDEGSRIQGLELGADDYLAKPFNPRELLARIKAVLRRQAPLVPGAPAGADEVVTFGDY
ncbi:two-component system response regulator AmgR, partial [Acinetobacter baumannii]